MYRVFAQIADPPDEAAMAPAVVARLAARLRIPPREVKRRFKIGATIRPRRQLTGPPLPPLLPAVAGAVGFGVLGEDHLKAITQTLDRLPSCTSDTDRAEVEATLVREAARHDADFVTELGKGIDTIFNPDGHYDENDRARRRGLSVGRRAPTGCRGFTAGSIRKPAATWKRPPPRCVPVGIFPTGRSRRSAMTAAWRSAATTASSSG